MYLIANANLKAQIETKAFGIAKALKKVLYIFDSSKPKLDFGFEKSSKCYAALKKN